MIYLAFLSKKSKFWTFRTNEIGVDTIKITSYPTGREGKPCSQLSAGAVKSDIKIILNVE